MDFSSLVTPPSLQWSWIQVSKLFEFWHTYISTCMSVMNYQHLALVLTLGVLLSTEVAGHYGFYGHQGQYRPFGHFGGGGRFQGGRGFPGNTFGGGRIPGGGGGGTTVNRPVGGTCPPVRPSCTASRSQPATCTSDRQCSGGFKCCFDACVQTEVCKAPV
nr:uncharacterized protein LOC123761667 isoform X2 [Procambarus clarkii]